MSMIQRRAFLGVAIAGCISGGDLSAWQGKSNPADFTSKFHDSRHLLWSYSCRCVYKGPAGGWHQILEKRADEEVSLEIDIEKSSLGNHCLTFVNEIGSKKVLGGGYTCNFSFSGRSDDVFLVSYENANAQGNRDFFLFDPLSVGIASLEMLQAGRRWNESVAILREEIRSNSDLMKFENYGEKSVVRFDKRVLAVLRNDIGSLPIEFSCVGTDTELETWSVEYAKIDGHALPSVANLSLLAGKRTRTGRFEFTWKRINARIPFGVSCLEKHAERLNAPLYEM